MEGPHSRCGLSNAEVSRGWDFTVLSTKGVGCRPQGLGLGACVLEPHRMGVQGSDFRVQGFQFRFWGQCSVLGFRFQVLGLGVQGWSLVLRVWCPSARREKLPTGTAGGSHAPAKFTPVACLPLKGAYDGLPLFIYL